MSQLSLVPLLKQYARPYRWHIAAGIALLLVTNALSMIIPWQLRSAIEALETSQGVIVDGFYFALYVLTAAAVGQGCIRVLSRWIIFGIGRSVEADVRANVYTFLLQQEPAYFRTRTVGDILSTLANDIQAIRMLFGFALLNLVNTIFALSMSMSLMVVISPTLTIFALGPLPVFFYVLSKFSKQMQQSFLGVQDALGTLSGHIQDELGTMELIRSFNLEANSLARFDVHNDNYFAIAARLAKIRSTIGPITILIGGFGGLVVFGYGGYLVSIERMSLGDFAAFQGYLGILVWPTMAFGWLWATLQRGLASMQRLDQLMARPQVLGPQSDFGATGGDLVCANFVVDIRSADKRFTVGPIDLTIREGQWTGVVGATGSGKSLFLQGLMHYIETSGTVSVGGCTVEDHTIQGFRHLLSYVPNKPLMFGGTIRENLQVIDPTLSDERILATLNDVAFGEDLHDMPNGINTVVGELGVTLSGGQRQRLGLARALLMNRPYLLMDDALSAVDAQTEDAIIKHLLSRNLTVIVATHRLSLLQHCDQLMVLHSGKQRECGSPAQLQQQGGLFAKLVARQALYQQVVEHE